MAKSENQITDIIDSLLESMNPESVFRLGYGYTKRNGVVNLEIIKRLGKYDADNKTSLTKKYMDGANFEVQSRKNKAMHSK